MERAEAEINDTDNSDIPTKETRSKSEKLSPVTIVKPEFFKTMNSERLLQSIEKPVTQPSPKEGYLVKEGHKFKTWKKRWFKLDYSVPSLEYFKEEKDKKAIKKIALTDASIQATGDKKRSNCFVIAPKGAKPLYVSCKDDQELQDWIKAVLYAISSKHK